MFFAQVWVEARASKLLVVLVPGRTLVLAPFSMLLSVMIFVIRLKSILVNSFEHVSRSVMGRTVVRVPWKVESGLGMKIVLPVFHSGGIVLDEMHRLKRSRSSLCNLCGPLVISLIVIWDGPGALSGLVEWSVLLNSSRVIGSMTFVKRCRLCVGGS